MKKFHAAVMATAVLALSSPSFADVIVRDGELAEVPYREVRFADLNLDTPEGLDRLNVRISAAVRSVCGQPDHHLLQQVVVVRDCRQDSTARAFAERDTILAARLAARGQPERLATVSPAITIGTSTAK